LESPGLKSREGKIRFSVLQNAETGCEVHPASFLVGSVFFPVDNSGGFLCYSSPPSSAEVNADYFYTLPPQTCHNYVDMDGLSFCYVLFERSGNDIHSDFNFLLLLQYKPIVSVNHKCRNFWTHCIIHISQIWIPKRSKSCCL